MKLAITILFLAAQAYGATTWYVATNGNDSTGDGTIGNPFLTISNGIYNAHAADTVSLGQGAYNEKPQTVRPGALGNYITFEGNGVASCKQFLIKHQYIKLQNLTVTGNTNAEDALVWIWNGAHYAIITNCTLDANHVINVYGLEWNTPTGGPFDSTDAHGCLIISNVIKGVFGRACVSMYGQTNELVGNFIHDVYEADFLRLWGRTNWIHLNTFSNNVFDAGSGNHPDFVQTFDNGGGFGSEGHIIERNSIIDNYGQICQLEGNLNTNIHCWMFRNNVFARSGMGASLSIPGIDFYNNVFFLCNLTNTGGALSGIGSRPYDVTNTPSGNLVAQMHYIVRTNGDGDGLGSIVYSSVTYSNGDDFNATNGVTYTTNGDGRVWLQIYNNATNCHAYNNVFLDCGGPSTNVGWYDFATHSITNFPGRDWCGEVRADYNYVGKNGYLPLKYDPAHKSVGDAAGWDDTRWWENHGINGGNPMFVDPTNLNFHLQAGSSLIGAGTNLGAFFNTDARGIIHDSSWDIGPYEYIATPATTVGMAMRLDFTGDFSSGRVIDLSGNGADGWNMNSTNWLTRTNGPNSKGAAQFTFVGVMTNAPPSVYDLSQYIAVTNISGFRQLTNMTISMWAQFGSNQDSGMRLLDTGFSYNFAKDPAAASNSWAIGRNSTPYVDFISFRDLGVGNSTNIVHFPNDTIGGGNYATTAFHLYSVTIDCTTNQIVAYYDGLPCDTNTIDQAYVKTYGCTNTPWLCVGAECHDGTPQWADDKYPNSAFMAGAMADIRIYNRTLSPQEVYGLFLDVGTNTSPGAGTFHAGTIRAGRVSKP